MPSATNLEAGLRRFLGLFDPTIALAETLTRARTNPQEVILLLCARLDALASSLVREDESNRKAFVQLVVKYSGHRGLMESVSAGDLYYELGYHRWLAEGMIPKPGRLDQFSRLNDPIIYLLDHSGVPLTIKDAEVLLTGIMRVLVKHFRCRPGQPTVKPRLGKVDKVISTIHAAFAHSRDLEVREKIAEAVRPLVESKTVAALLYEKFRNEAVHSSQVPIDENQFFSAQTPYWKRLYSEYYPSFSLIEFPARFLTEVLRNCLKTLGQHMLATGKLPPDVHSHAFGFGLDHLQFLDTDLLPDIVRLKFRR